MKGFDVLKVKSAIKTHNQFDLSRTHLTTMDFGQIVPLFCEETVPGDSFSIDGEYFSRMAPLVKPTYGKFSFKTVAGFVPYHQVAYDADAWFAGKTTWEGITPRHRFITLIGIHDFLTDNCIAIVEGSEGPDATNSDYTYIDGNGETVYNWFSPEGKYFVKVLNALGYSIPQNVDLQEESVWVTKLSMLKLSAYPLLAFAKLYNDYMSQSQRYNSSQLSNFLRCVKYGINPGDYTYIASTGEVTGSGISMILGNIKLNYENDYFTSAWMQPNVALSGSGESIVRVAVPDIAASAAYESNAYRGAGDQYLEVPADSTIAVVGQRALDFLKSFDDWVRRNNYSGSRAVQQIYSRFGIKTDDYKSHYAQVISTDTIPVQVGDVTSTADTSGASLGDYSGKGIMNGNKNVSVKVSDYGLIIILGYYTVAPMMAFGYDRKVLRNTPLDYYNPEFDGLGADPISVGEVWTSPIVVGDTVQDNGVFGFTERYNAYRYGRDQITGEFRNYHEDGDMNCWHTGRNLASLRHDHLLYAQSTAMNTLPQYDSEYNRIFSVTSDDVDHFYMTARFTVKAVRPMLNLNQVPRLGEGDTVVPRNGNVIS